METDYTIQPRYYSGDPSTLPLLEEVLERIPAEAARFARRRRWFLVTGRVACGRCVQGRNVKNRHLLVVAAAWDDDLTRWVMAHELAHAVVFNAPSGDHLGASPEWREEQVRVVLRNWGWPVDPPPDRCA